MLFEMLYALYIIIIISVYNVMLNMVFIGDQHVVLRELFNVILVVVLLLLLLLDTSVTGKMSLGWKKMGKWLNKSVKLIPNGNQRFYERIFVTF